MKIKISINPVPGTDEFRIAETRGGKVPNHLYNSRRSALKCRLAYIKAIQEGSFQFVGLTGKEQEMVHDALT